MRCGVIVLVAVLAAPWAARSAPVPAPARPYSVRDIPLGITLTEFRRLPHPDARAEARIHCSNEPGAGDLEGLTLTATLLQADAIKCGFYQLERAAEGARLATAPMGFFGEQITPLFLFYRSEGAADYSLAQITFALSNSRAGELIGLFYRAFGTTASLDVTSVPTSFGAEMSDVTYVWHNGVSTIQLDSLSFVLNEMSVVFFDNQLWADLSERLTAVERLRRIANQEEQRQRAEAERAAHAEPSSLDVPASAPPVDSGAAPSAPR